LKAIIAAQISPEVRYSSPPFCPPGKIIKEKSIKSTLPHNIDPIITPFLNKIPLLSLLFNVSACILQISARYLQFLNVILQS
jgi:hypothetical protein